MTTDNFSEEPGVGGVLDATDTYREQILAEALRRSQMHDPDVADMWRSIGVPGPPFPKHWCGAFALATIRAVLPSCTLEWVIGRGFALGNLPTTTEPKPGDVAIYQRNWHHALVRRVDGRNVSTIDGNQGPGGATVGDSIFALRERRLPDAYGYYSIEPLLVAQVEADAAKAYAATDQENEA